MATIRLLQSRKRTIVEIKKIGLGDLYKTQKKIL